MRLILARARKHIRARIRDRATPDRQRCTACREYVRAGQGCVYQWPAVQLCKQPPAVPGDSVGGFGGGENSPLVFHKLQCRSACLCKNGKYCVVNNTYEPQQTTVYRGRQQFCGRPCGQCDPLVRDLGKKLSAVGIGGERGFPTECLRKIHLGRKADRLGNFCDRKVGVF